MSTNCSNQEVLDLLGSDTQLWSPSTMKEAKPSEILANKLVLFYFSAHWCGPCRRFTPMLIELYKKLKARGDAVEDFELVFCSMDRTDEEYKSYTSDMPWWCLPHTSPVMGKLANLYGASGIPHLVVLEKDGSVLVKEGVGEVSTDPEGTSFPWRPKPLVDLLPTKYVTNDGNLRETAELDDKYLMLYFSAHWCPPCKRFTPKLSAAYSSLKERRDDFELIFVSSDKDKQSFDEYVGEMTFCAFPFEERQAKANVSSRLEIRGIPALVMLGPKPANGGDRPVINANARNVFEQGDYLSDFPYRPKMYGDLNTTSDNINNFKCFIVFHEGGDDDEQEDIQEAVQMASKSEESDKNMRFFWATAPMGLAKTVRDALKLGPIRAEPLMVLLDVPNASFYVSPTVDVTMDSIQEFIRNPGEQRKL